MTLAVVEVQKGFAQNIYILEGTQKCYGRLTRVRYRETETYKMGIKKIVKGP